MKTRKSRGPLTVPWVTPDGMGEMEGSETPFTMTEKVRLERKSKNHEQMREGKSNLGSLVRRREWLTWSKNFCFRYFFEF